MINNSNLYRWSRLAAKSLDRQFVNEIIHGLNCSPFEAEAVLESVYRVFGDYFDSSENLKPGQIRLPVISIEAQSNQRLSDAKQVTVTLTLIDDQEDLPIRKQFGVAGLRRHRIQRICQQALDQGGLLTVEDLVFADLRRRRFMLHARGGILHIDIGEGVRPALVADEHRVALREVARVVGVSGDLDLAAVGVLSSARRDSLGDDRRRRVVA